MKASLFNNISTSHFFVSDCHLKTEDQFLVICIIDSLCNHLYTSLAQPYLTSKYGYKSCCRNKAFQSRVFYRFFISFIRFFSRLVKFIPLILKFTKQKSIPN